MEIDAMSRVAVAATIENVVDLYNAEAGIIQPAEVRKLEVQDALIDTGSTHLAMPWKLIERLGFSKPFTTHRSLTTQGTVDSNVFGPVRLTVQGRNCSVDVAEIAENCPVLIGQIPLEALDFVVDLKERKLIGNPAHGGQHMLELY